MPANRTRETRRPMRFWRPSAGVVAGRAFPGAAVVVDVHTFSLNLSLQRHL
jgi:hypothetical protein